MRHHRFFAVPEAIADSRVTLSDEETHHMVRVLRLRPGDPVFVFDGQDHEFKCIFESVREGHAILEVTDMLVDRVESPVHLTLVQALAKGEKFDVIVQKSVELGAMRIVPLITDFADVKVNAESAQRRMIRWNRIAMEATKQCGRRRLVRIKEPATLEEYLHRYVEAGEPVLLFNERGGVSLLEAMADRPDSKRAAALIGPEGGWSDAEIELLERHGAVSVSLGPRILRTETAAVVAIALLQSITGDLAPRFLHGLNLQ